MLEIQNILHVCPPPDDLPRTSPVLARLGSVVVSVEPEVRAHEDVGSGLGYLLLLNSGGLGERFYPAAEEALQKLRANWKSWYTEVLDARTLSRRELLLLRDAEFSRRTLALAVQGWEFWAPSTVETLETRRLQAILIRYQDPSDDKTLTIALAHCMRCGCRYRMVAEEGNSDSQRNVVLQILAAQSAVP